MNLSLGFPDLSEQLGIERRSGLEAAVARFEQAMGGPDSPIRAIRRQQAREAQYEPMPENLHQSLRAGLLKRGIDKLYTHQADAWRLAEQGRNAVIVTPTASGKTLCYNLPVLQRILAEPSSLAIYLFPTKALAEDQLHGLQSLLDAMGSDVRAFTYDGDTPQDARKAVRERANIILTNPDMLHAGVLPHHTKWAKCFENLRYLVIDELHSYRGVYGSHLANLLRRLKRICDFYGSKPQFLCCSATIANPRNLAEALTGEQFEIIDRNGAPGGEKYFVFYNPPVVNRALGIRRSYLHETRRIATEFIDRGQQTLVFANNRLATEILLTYLKESCQRYPKSPDLVRGYRGGYLPRERREIERMLRDGEIRAVVSTSALELGVDVGSLDAVVLAGYPGTIASTLQRAGRAGRRQTGSIAVFVASSAPLDQYIVEHPEYFFGRSPEHAYVNADNLEIVLSHLKCAAFELPVQQDEKFGPHPVADLCRFIEELGFLHRSGNAWHWTSDTYPADAVSLRSISSDNFVVIDTTHDNQVIAEVSFPMALTALHEKAIYLHEARQYQVERFDYEGRKAYVRQVDCDYFTDAMEYTQVKILEEFGCASAGSGSAAHGDVRVNTQVVGWKKIKFFTLENVGFGHLSMPEQEMHTTSFWLHFPEPMLAALADVSPAEKQSGINGLGNAMRTVGALLLMCDPRDLGIALTEDMPGVTWEPNLYLYDALPGGVGLSAPLFRLADRLVAETRNLIDHCPCEAGCPSCVGPVGAVGERGKEIAVRLLALLDQTVQFSAAEAI